MGNISNSSSISQHVNSLTITVTGGEDIKETLTINPKKTKLDDVISYINKRLKHYQVRYYQSQGQECKAENSQIEWKVGRIINGFPINEEQPIRASDALNLYKQMDLMALYKLNETNSDQKVDMRITIETVSISKTE
ncbi:hypothetical protein RFI_21960 [Reticulomyxa filosa]|uniref:Uncharacterized protein n=1 Tax=Reticulomyxa filosa TaxID=46433 RepID=X6MNK1_RETFI|nr:hypothetical protein RFI_21960 [Reticulomyxa filosa]|eukprot:ETO15404.1 hypothetical protein RFI_21960 [Reticulomyxa filosa]